MPDDTEAKQYVNTNTDDQQLNDALVRAMDEIGADEPDGIVVSTKTFLEKVIENNQDHPGTNLLRSIVAGLASVKLSDPEL